MEIKLLEGLDRPLTKLSDSQQRRFLKKLADFKETNRNDMYLGMEMSLILMGYAVIDE